MGKGLNRHIEGRQLNEKVPSVINHQGNANQNYSEVLVHTYQNGCHPKRQEVTSVSEGVHRCWESTLVQPPWKQYGGSSKC